MMTKVKFKEQTLAFFALLVPIVFMIYTTWPNLVNDGYLFARDAGGHLLRAQYWAHYLLPKGTAWGWFPLWYGGFNLYHVYPVLTYYLLGLLTLILPALPALKFTMAFLWLALVPTAYYFLRGFRLRPTHAALGTFLIPLLNGELSVGTTALYQEGFLPNATGFIFSIIALRRLKEDLAGDRRALSALLVTGICVAFTILSHPFCAYWWIWASLLLLITEIIGGHQAWATLLKRYLLVLSLGLLLSAYWWIAFLLNLDEMKRTDPFALTDIAGKLISMEHNGGWKIVLLAAFGIIYLFVKKEWKTLGFLGGAAVLSFLLSTGVINPFLPMGEMIQTSQRLRFEAYYYFFIITLAAFSIPLAWTLAGFFPWPTLIKALRLSFSIFLFSMILTVRDNVRGFIHPISNPATRQIEPLRQYLLDHLQPGDFILTEDNWAAIPSLGTPHFLHHNLPQGTDRLWDLSGGLPEGTRGCVRPSDISYHLDKTGWIGNEEDYLRHRGVRYVVTSTGLSRRTLLKEHWLRLTWPDPRLTGEWSPGADFLALFELKNFNTRFGLPPEASALIKDLTYQAPGQYLIQFEKPVTLEAKTSLTLNYHPWLQVKANGKEISKSHNANFQMVLPEKAENIVTLEIRYVPPFPVQAANKLSALGWILGVLYLGFCLTSEKRILL
ncbi:MAG: hypothetical protein LHV69_05035 [Elusimicrobia bacterium]|nr:hypothetical protein [Candidatus Obscuribacterium magneticum]